MNTSSFWSQGMGSRAKRQLKLRLSTISKRRKPTVSLASLCLVDVCLVATPLNQSDCTWVTISWYKVWYLSYKNYFVNMLTILWSPLVKDWTKLSIGQITNCSINQWVLEILVQRIVTYCASLALTIYCQVTYQCFINFKYS